MFYDPQGVRFVLTAPDTESTEEGFSPWKQMVYASVPAQLVPRFVYEKHLNQQSHADGTAVVMPYGVRIVEAILLEEYPPEDVAVCHPDNLHLFVGRRTRAVGIAAHNPIGVAFSISFPVGPVADIANSSTRYCREACAVASSFIAFPSLRATATCTGSLFFPLATTRARFFQTDF